MIPGPLAGFAPPLQAGQILWVNLLAGLQLDPRDFLPCLLAAALAGAVAKWQAHRTRTNRAER